jgi:NTE family protein
MCASHSHAAGDKPRGVRINHVAGVPAGIACADSRAGTVVRAMETPDHLVLGGGGTLGIAWLRGVLDGIAEHGDWDPRDARSFVGTSAGSLVSAGLAAGRRPGGDSAEGQAWAQAAPDAQMRRDGGRGWLAWAGSAVRPLAPFALAATASGGAAVRAAALSAMPRGRPRLHQVTRGVERLDTTFDGRLRVVTVDRASGRRVIFGAPGAPEAGVAEAVTASCSIPWVFAPVRIGGREYVDGGVWSLTNLDATPAAKGERVLCLVPTGAAQPTASPLALLRLVTHASLLAEVVAVRSRGAQVQVVTPDGAVARELGTNLMDASRVGAVSQAAREQGRALAA